MSQEQENETFEQIEARIDAEDKARADAEAGVGAVLEPPPVVTANVDEAAKAAEAQTAADAQAKADADAKAAADAEAAKKAEDDRPRDKEGRFVKVAVHAQEMGKRDARIAELEQQLAASQTTATSVDPAKLREKLAKLQGEGVDGAAMLEVMAEQQALLEQQAAQTAELRKLMDQREQADKDARANAVQTAIDAVPDLAQWQADAFKEGATDEDKALFEAARVHDRALRASPKWKDQPEAKRFEEVARRVREDYGLAQPAAPTPAVAAPTPTPKALPATPAAVPATLSAVPGGAPTPISTTEAFVGADPISALAATSRMSDKEFEAYMGRLN